MAGVTGYEHADAWEQDWLKVDDTHEVYYEQYGKKDGKPGNLNLIRVGRESELTKPQ